MARSRSQSAPRLTRDASRLITLAQALNRSGSRVEDIFWEAQLAEAIPKLLKAGQDAPLEAALDHLAQADVGAYEVLIEQAETLSESTKIDKNGVRHDVLLVVAPVVAWTRYAIPTGAISASAQQAVLAQLHGHVLSSQARAAPCPGWSAWTRCRVPSPKPGSGCNAWTQALGAETMKTGAEHRGRNGEHAGGHPLHRRRGGRARARPHLPLAGTDWRRRRQPRSLPATMGAQAQPTLAALLPGCGFESLLPDAYYVSNREADRRVRPRCRCAPPSAGSKARSISKPRNCGPWWPAAAKAGSTNTASASPRATTTTCTTVASGRCTGARKTCRPTKASLTWSTKSPRCSRNTASTTCAAFRPAAARLLRGLRRALLPESAGRTGARRAARGRRGRAGQVPLGSAMRADIFCRVVDNYGDIGVCWRLARRLAQVPGWRPRLWVDDCGPSPASSQAGPGTGAPAMPGHRHHPLDAGAARRPDARRRGDRGLRLRSARRLPGCHAPGPSGLDQPGIPERRSLDRKLSRPAVATARRAGQAFLLSRFHSGHGRTAARARPVRRTRRAAGFARTTGVRAARAGRAAARAVAPARRRSPRVPVLLSERAGRRTGLGPGRRSAPDRAAGARRRGARPETACAAPGRPALVRLLFVSQPDFDRCRVVRRPELRARRGSPSCGPPGPRVRWSGRSTRSTTRSIWTSRGSGWLRYPRHRRRPR